MDSPPIDSLRPRLVEASIALTVAAAVSFAALHALRSGLGDPPRAAFCMWLNCLLPIWFSACTALVLDKSAARRSVVSSAALTVALLFPALGLVLGRYVCIIAGAATAAFVLISIAHLRGMTFKSILRALIAGVALAFLVLASSAPGRLLLPEQMTLGLAQADNLFHIAIAQMIAHHGFPSLGADGLTYEHYHFASHAVAAGLSNAAGASVALVYTYWGALSLKLELLWALLLSGVFLSPRTPNAPAIRILPRVFYAMLILILSDSLESESFLLGLAIYIGLLPVLCYLVDEKTESPTFYGGLLLAVITSCACAVAKVSVGFYCAVALLWIAWMHRKDFRTLLVAFAGLVILGAGTVLFLSPTDLTVTSQGLVIIVMAYVGYFGWTALLSYGLPLLLIVIAITRPQFARTAERATLLRLSVAVEALRPKLQTFSSAARTFLELDAAVQLSALSLAACVAVLVVVPIGGNMAYFSVVLLVAGGCVLPSTLLRASDIEISRRPLSVGLWVLVFVVGLACAEQFATAAARTVATLFRTAWADSGDPAAQTPAGGMAGRQIAQSIHGTGTVFGLLHQEIDTLPWNVLMRDIRDKSALPGGLVVHVTPSADDLWRRLTAGSPYWCMAAQLMIPAETGVIEIRSIAPVEIEHECAPKGVLWYGFGRNQDLHRTGNLSVDQLCRAASLARARRIYMLSSIAQPSKNEIIDCAASPAMRP